MATLAMFRAQFVEFNNVSDPTVATFLSAASLEIDTSVWGQFGQLGGNITKADQGQMYLAAHKLATSPAGQNARVQFLKPVGPSKVDAMYTRTTYGLEFLNLRYSVTSGFRVA